MLGITITIVLATAMAFWGNQLPDLYWLSYLPLLLMLTWLIPGYRLIWLFMSVFLWSSFHLERQLGQQLNDDADGQVYLLTGRIADIPLHHQHALRFSISPDAIQNYDWPLPEKIQLSWYQTQQQPKAGERWQLRVKLRKATGFQNPGGFDFERWMFVSGIGARGYVKQSTDNRQLSEAPWWHINRYRTGILERIRADCAECRQSGLFQALSIGFRSEIPRPQRDLLRTTGTAHLLAISGLHVGLIAAVFYGFGHFLWVLWGHRCRLNRLEFSAILALVAATIYAALAGFSIPTLRALMMLAVVFLALMQRRGINLLNSIAIAASLILILDPLAIGSTSFWLSISALLVIALGQLLLPEKSGWFNRLVRIQLLFSLLLIPLNLLLFEQISLVSFIANMIAIPWISLVILPLILMATLLSVMQVPLAGWLFLQVDWMTDWFFSFLTTLVRFGPKTYASADIPVMLLLFASIGVLLLLLPVSRSLAKPALMLVLLPLFWRPESIPQGGFRLTVLDVGMGTAVVVETRHHSLLYDFGPGNNSGFSAGDWVVKPYLQHRGIQSPDYMIISHVDQDHSGGFISFLDDYDPATLFSGTPAMLQKRFQLQHEVRSCHHLPGWEWDGVFFEFLSSPEFSESKSNDRSCVLKVSGFQSALLSGDIEAKKERRLGTAMPERLAAEVLLVPHHGSLTSSTESFIRRVMPEIAIFTLGRKNRWGFPKAKVVSRYQRLGSRIYRSDRHGAVTLLSQKQGMQVNYSRQVGHRLWR